MKRAMPRSASPARDMSYITGVTGSSSVLKYTYPESLYSTPVTQVTKMSNGITVASETNKNFETVTVGLWINAGSRCETPENNGTAHFLEHMSFKGTKNRSQKNLELEIENMGANLNAYTSREQTVYYSKVLKSDVEKAFDILYDITQNPIISEDAIERERDVILREAKEVEKQKEEVVFDHLHASAFQGSSLGMTILGPEENIAKITRSHLIKYIEDNYRPESMVLAAAGGISHEELMEIAEKKFGKIPVRYSTKVPQKAQFYGSDFRARFDNHPTAHVAIAVEGVSWTSPDYWPLLVAQSIIGNWDRYLGATSDTSSRLAQKVHKYNLCNSFMSFNTSYSDTGLFGVYAVSQNFMELNELINCIQREWTRLCMSVSDVEVFRAKNQLKTSLLLALEGTTAIAEDIGRQMLIYGKRASPVETDALIEKVTAKQVMEVASKYIYDKEVCLVGYGPVESLPDYTRVRAAMSPIYH